MKPEAHRILIADDHPLYRSALAELIDRTSGMTLVGEVDDLAGALAALDKAQGEGQACHLVVLDLKMPGMDGTAGVLAVRQRSPATKIALISGHLEPSIVAAALAAGATGFVPKSFDPEVILAAIRLVLTGAIYVPHDLVASALPTPPLRQENGMAAGEPVLTPRELDVLTRMARGETYKVIARALGIAEITVKLHAQRITRKLGAKNRAAAIATAVKARLIETE